MTSSTSARRRGPRRAHVAPRFYFSFRSPYSWLAHRDLAERHATVAGTLELIPFWEPDELTGRMLAEAGGAFSYTAMSRAKHLYILQDVRRLAAARGLSVRWPVDRSPCWEVPHLAYLVAARHGRARDFADRVYRARWEEGRDVCDVTTIGSLAEELGLDADSLTGAADDRRLRAEGVRALLAVDRDGVFGVPFFVNGTEKYWGVDRLDQFVCSLGDGARRGNGWEEGEAWDELPGADSGHAGGCG